MAVVLALATVTLLATPLAAQSGPDAAPPSLDELLEDQRCVAHELNVPGQGLYLSGSGLYLSGSVGGMMLGPIEYRDDTGAEVTLTAVPVTELLDPSHQAGLTQFVQQALDQDVVIFVADDFAGGEYAVPPDVFGLTDDPADRQALEDLVRTGRFSHGALVLHHLNALIAATNSFTLATSTDSRFVWQQRSTDRRLVVEALDLSTGAAELITADGVHGALTDALSGAVSRLVAEVEPRLELGGVVVNMSWVFLPCQTVEAFMADIDKYASLDAYLEALGITGASMDFEQVMRLLRQVDHPQLEALLNGREGPAGTVSFVAASGNFSLPYQMLPAGWSHVVGVAVTPVTPVVRPFPGRYSNAGDVHVPDEWIALQPWHATPAPSLDAQTDLSYAGTSFAAPLVSLYVAQDLVGKRECDYQPGSPPPLTNGSTSSQPGDVPLPIAIGAC